MESSSSSDSADDEVIDAFPNFHDCNTHDDQQSSSTTSPNSRRPENDSDNEISIVDSLSDINEEGESWVTSVSPRPPASKTNEEACSSVVTALDNNNDDGDQSSVGGGGGGSGEFHESNLLIHVAAFVIKAIGFQFNLFFTMVAFPFWCFSTLLMFMMDPFSIMARGRNYMMAKLLTACNSIWKHVNPFGFFGDRKSISELAWKLSVGLFWSIYVCSLLMLLLVCAIVITGFMMSFLAVEPVVMEERLNFDYTKNSPVAYFPIAAAASCGGHKYCQETIDEVDRKSCNNLAQIIPPNRKLFATLKLTLPESDYNRNLGMFQVRVELLSGNGDTVSRSSHPCMLPYKSEPIRVLMTMLKLVPLIAGYMSESQTITVHLRGLVEHNNVASTCVKVVVEQRAQFLLLQSGGGSGIPEIYDAWLILEAELPLLKRLVWNWRRTTFVWTTMVFFIMELLLMLFCCRPLFLPTLRPR